MQNNVSNQMRRRRVNSYVKTNNAGASSSAGLFFFALFTIMMVCFIVYNFMMINSQSQQNSNLRNEIRQTQNRIAELERIKTNYLTELENYKNDKYITSHAKKLGLRPTTAAQAVDGRDNFSAGVRRNQEESKRLRFRDVN